MNSEQKIKISLASHADRQRVACGLRVTRPDDPNNYDRRLTVMAEFHQGPLGYCAPVSIDPREATGTRADVLPFVINNLAERRVQEFVDQHPRPSAPTGRIVPGRCEMTLHDEPCVEVSPEAVAVVHERMRGHRPDQIQQYIEQAARNLAEQVDARMIAAFEEAQANDRSMDGVRMFNGVRIVEDPNAAPGSLTIETGPRSE